MTFPPWDTIPPHRSAIRTPEDWELWEKWGNDEDGVQGDRIPPGLQRDDDGYRFGSDMPLTQERFERWWKRNPRHNKHFHTQRKPVIDPFYVLGQPREDDYRHELNNFVVLRFRPFFIKVGRLYSGYRSDKPAWPGAPWWPDDLGQGGGAYDPIGAKTLHYP